MSKNKGNVVHVHKNHAIEENGGVEVQLYRRLKYLFVNSDRLRDHVGFGTRKKLVVHRLVTGEEKLSVAAWESNRAHQDS